MTDSAGMLQHATSTIPNFAEGYCTDDNARALLLTVLLEQLGQSTPQVHRLATTYAAFLNYAFDRAQGPVPQLPGLRPAAGSRRSARTTATAGHSGCWGPASAGRGAATCSSGPHSSSTWRCRRSPRRPRPRAWAFGLIGVCLYLQRFSGARPASQVRDTLTERLIELLDEDHDRGLALVRGGPQLRQRQAASRPDRQRPLRRQPRALDVGLQTLGWLVDQQKSPTGYFRPIGSNGFYHRDRERAQFDQQPIEAHATVSACIEAYHATDDPGWLQEARLAFEWFLGGNDLGLDLYDAKTGGCCDGLQEDRVNLNQGAESTLAFLLSPWRDETLWKAPWRTSARCRSLESVPSRFGTYASLDTEVRSNLPWMRTDRRSPRNRSSLTMTTAGESPARRRSRLNVRRTGIVLKPNNSRVVIRPFEPTSEQRIERIIARIMSLSEPEVDFLLEDVMGEFHNRHQKNPPLLSAPVRTGQEIPLDQPAVERESPDADRRVLHPGVRAGIGGACSIRRWSGTPTSRDWSRARAGSSLSLRATGEGHISSITFRSGTIDAENRIRMDEPTRFVTAPEQVPNTLYDKTLFFRKLLELGVDGPFAGKVLATLNDQFTLDELQRAIRRRLAPEPAAAPRESSRSSRGCSPWPRPTTRSATLPSRTSRSGSSSPLHPPRPTASRTPASSSSTTTTARSATTPPTPPSTAR